MISRKPRQRTCECGCGRKFTPSSSFITWATIECAIAVLKIRQAKKERKELKARKEAIKRPSEIASEAQVAVNALVRYRDRDEPCISCGRMTLADPLTGGAWDAGHYRSRGSAIHLRFDHERNIHKQCKRCNRDLGGNHVEFRKGLIRKIGIAAVEALEADNAPRRFRADDYRRIRDEARAQLSHLKTQERNKT